MGTRSLTYVLDNGVRLICMYRQMDGYPAGHGYDLVNFMDGLVIVDGLGADNNVRVANGAECFAAQLVADFKDGPGSIYLMPPGPHILEAGQEYEYHVDVKHTGEIEVSVYDGNHATGQLLYKGLRNGFVEFIMKERDES